MPRGKYNRFRNREEDEEKIRITPYVKEFTRENILDLQEKLQDNYDHVPTQGEIIDFLLDYYLKHSITQ